MRLSLLLLGLSVLTGCRSGYERMADSWGWRSSNAGVGSVVRPLDLDTTTFVQSGVNHARDHRLAYYKWTPIPGADAPSFEAIDETYSRDRSHVYLREHLVPGADPTTFEVLGRPYGRDAQHVYCGTVPIPGVDAAAFEVTREGDGWMVARAGSLPPFLPESLSDSLLARGFAADDMVVMGSDTAEGDPPSGRAGDRVIVGCL